jgi:acyl carrier protein
MLDDEIYSALTEVFREVFCDDDLVLRPDLSARDVPGWDSLRHVRLVLAIERRFKHRYPASKVAALHDVGELAALVKSYT